MKPSSRRVKHSSSLFQKLVTGPVVGKVSGTVKEFGSDSSNSFVVLYNKVNLAPIAIRKPDKDGNYSFLGLNTSLNCYLVAFDITKKYNAVIQDNIVPK